MSAAQQPVLPDPETAYETLFRDVHSQVFFRKCAAAGLVPQTAAEADEMLKLAGKLRAVSESSQVKAAGAQDNPFVRMNAGLDQWMAANGYGTGGVSEDVGFRKAAAELADDPTYYNAVLSLKVEEASAAKAQFDATASR